MTGPIRLLLIEENPELAERIMTTLAVPTRSGIQFEVDLRTADQAASSLHGGGVYAAAAVDLSSDAERTFAALWKIRSADPDLDIALLLPEGHSQVPVEVVELGLSPVVILDDEGIDSLPIVLAALCDGNGDDRSRSKTSLLRVRHQELRDITDSLARQSVHLIRLRNELATEKGKMETVINGMTDGMAYFDIEGRLEVANPIVCGLFPALIEQGLDLTTFLAPLPRREVPMSAIERHGGELFETSIGTGIYRVRIQPIYRDEDDPAGTLVFFTDVTREKEYEELKNDFTNMISHELRTPLTSIRAAVDNFLRGALGAVNDDQKKFLELIARNVDRQQGLIDNLLDLAKLEAGLMDVRLSRGNLTLVAVHAVEEYWLAFKDKGVMLLLNKEEIPSVPLDPPLMSQAVENLLSNALKFTDAGGKVTVSVQHGQVEGRPGVAVVIEDTGIGIRTDKQHVVFDKYIQGDTGARRRYGGTGLGLAICKEIAKAHKGTIDVVSTPGEGSRFTLTVPVEQELSGGTE